MTKVTLKTLADSLGVSLATVSNAYNRPERLSAELRERVLAEAAALGYPGPDPAARTLRRGRAGVLGVVFTDALPYAFEDPGAVAFLRGLAGAGEEAGLGVQLVSAGHDRPRADGVRHAVVDGLVLFSLPDEHPALSAALERGLPLVTCGGPRRPDAAFVGIDDRAAAREIAEHLLAAGHARLAVVTPRIADGGAGGRVDARRLAAASYSVKRNRLAGVADALAAAGMDAEAVPIEERVGNAREAGADAATALLAGGSSEAQRPTAIVALTDELALGVLSAAEELGLRVPTDLAVTGFDDAGPAAAAGLTTVAQDLFAQGRRAAELARDGWTGDPPDVLAPTRLVLRATG